MSLDGGGMEKLRIDKKRCNTSEGISCVKIATAFEVGTTILVN